MSTPRGQRIGIWIIAIVMAIGAVGVYFVAILANNNDQAALSQYEEQQTACPSGQVTDKTISPAPSVPAIEAVPAGVSEVTTKDITVGSGQTVVAGDCVEILYHGVLAMTGVAFAGGDNYADGVPYRSSTTGFVEGFGEGLVGMKVGGERLVYIPSAKAYADQSNGEIPANSDLIFAIRLVGIY